MPIQPPSPLDFAIAENNRATMAMVRRAVETNNVVLAYQPVVQAANLDQVSFYEGLVRIREDNGRIIPAADFIDGVETTELGRKIDCLSLQMGLAELAEDPTLRLSINMSARSIGYPPWMRQLRRGLARDETVGERLVLEITESSAMIMPDLVTVFMNDLQAEGVCFALDDFGAGYTSFRYLREFYFDIVKIDGQFIKGIADNADNQILAQALLSIARHFDMFTVAEAVEDERDLQFLTALGMDCLQGYYFGAPSLASPRQARAKRMTA